MTSPAARSFSFLPGVVSEFTLSAAFALRVCCTKCRLRNAGRELVNMELTWLGSGDRMVLADSLLDI